MSEGQNESTGSEARRVFEAQSHNVLHLLGGIVRDIKQLNDPIEAIENILVPTAAGVAGLGKDNPESNMASALGDISTNVGMLHAYTDEIASRMQVNMRVHPFLEAQKVELGVVSRVPGVDTVFIRNIGRRACL